MGFNLASKELLTSNGVAFDLAYTLEINEFNGRRKIQANIKAIRENSVTM
ncbi:MAG: hypothetical protein ACK444_00395 [Flavobacteriales bacterium]